MAGSALHVSYRLPERGLDIALRVPDGSTTALIGPNGSGKSSTFEVVSGLLRPRGAEVLASDRRLHELPPHRRRVGLLLQQPLLFPTMDVLENTAFGLRAAGVRRAAAHAAARSALEEVGAPDLATRRPASLSGGQAQRVAVARALAPDPELLLLDEPMAALDEDSRETIGTLLARVLVDRTAVLITHSAGEARALSDRVVVLGDGRVVQQGTWSAIAEAPASAFARRFARDRGEGPLSVEW
ncbi:MAG: ATP-binding cassette domain-containing protein [Nesterenkonia sp.]|nr:ATP-binding cassette domain-containing protein [Nesterenkonia sp.]